MCKCINDSYSTHPRWTWRWQRRQWLCCQTCGWLVHACSWSRTSSRDSASHIADTSWSCCYMSPDWEIWQKYSRDIIENTQKYMNQRNISKWEMWNIGIGNRQKYDDEWHINIIDALNILNSLCTSDGIWQRRSGSTLAQVMACCLTAPSHYLNQCWLIISEVPWH